MEIECNFKALLARHGSIALDLSLQRGFWRHAISSDLKGSLSPVRTEPGC